MKTPPTNMAHEELERWHYADGDTALATMHAVAADGEECELAEIQRLKDELDTAGSELDDANEEIDRLTVRLAELEDELAELKNLA